MKNCEIVLLSESAKIPKRATEYSAGYDLYACNEEPVEITPGGTCIIPLGFSMKIQDGYECQIRSRSGLAAKNNVVVTNSPGTIDSDYIGEWKVILTNLHKTDSHTVKRGDRIAQGVFAKVESVDEFTIVKSHYKTDRNDGGFGHTGT